MCEKFSFGVTKIQRGQVWFLEEADEVTKVLRDNGAKALNGRRPYFIVNVNGIMVNCVPMTTNTNGSDHRNDDICFTNPINDTESRIVVSQITTHCIAEFSKYLYTFDEDATREILHRIQMSLFGEKDTIIRPRSLDIPAKGIPKSETIEPKTLPPEEANKLCERLQRYFKLSPSQRKAEAMFRNQEEGLLFINEFYDKPTTDLAALFGVDKAVVYRMRTKAKEAAYWKKD